MKKVIYLFVLCMVLGLAGCGQSQENKEPSTESTSVQVENKNVSDIVSNEHLTNNDEPFRSLQDVTAYVLQLLHDEGRLFYLRCASGR